MLPFVGRVFETMGIMVERPYLALVPALAFFLLDRASHRTIVRVAAIAWAVYCVDEYGNKLRILCSGECNIRVDLVLIYPFLLAVSLAALIVGVRSARDWRHSQKST